MHRALFVPLLVALVAPAEAQVRRESFPRWEASALAGEQPDPGPPATGFGGGRSVGRTAIGVVAGAAVAAGIGFGAVSACGDSGTGGCDALAGVGFASALVLIPAGVKLVNPRAKFGRTLAGMLVGTLAGTAVAVGLKGAGQGTTHLVIIPLGLMLGVVLHAEPPARAEPEY